MKDINQPAISLAKRGSLLLTAWLLFTASIVVILMPDLLPEYDYLAKPILGSTFLTGGILLIASFLTSDLGIRGEMIYDVDSMKKAFRHWQVKSMMPWISLAAAFNAGVIIVQVIRPSASRMEYDILCTILPIVCVVKYLRRSWSASIGEPQKTDDYMALVVGSPRGIELVVTQRGLTKVYYYGKIISSRWRFETSHHTRYGQVITLVDQNKGASKSFYF